MRSKTDLTIYSQKNTISLREHTFRGKKKTLYLRKERPRKTDKVEKQRQKQIWRVTEIRQASRQRDRETKRDRHSQTETETKTESDKNRAGR